MSDRGERSTLRRLTARALIGGLCVAAAVALVALLSGSMDNTDWKIVGTSLGFSVFSASAAAGGSLRLRHAGWAQQVGLATIVASTLAFMLLAAALWVDSDSDGIWQAWGIAALLALWGSHASAVLRPLRASDATAIKWLSGMAIGTLGIDTWIGVLAILDVFDDAASDPMQRTLAATIILALLSSALVVILRRMAPPSAASGARVSPSSAEVAFGALRAPQRAMDLSAEITAVAADLDALPANPEIRSAAARLRELAEQAGG